MFVELSTQLKEDTRTGLSGEQSGVFKWDVTLHNPNTEYNLEVQHLEALIITSQFAKSYCDQWQMGIKVRPEDYRELLTNMKDLEVTIKLTPVDMVEKKVYDDQDPLIYKLRVIIDDQTDLDKKFNPGMFGKTDNTNDGKAESQNQGQAEALIDMQINMLEPEAYLARHIEMNSIHNVDNMESLVQWIISQLKNEQESLAEIVNVAAPDNKEALENAVIPPTMNIGQVFPFLQERYGIYHKGLGCYFTNKAFYIYPLYNHNRDLSLENGVLHIVNAPKDYFGGLEKYHSTIDDDLWIVTVTDKNQQSLATAGVENVGNAHMSTNADTAKDQFAPIRKDGKVMIPDGQITTVGMSNTGSNMDSEAQNAKFYGERTNIFASTSQMAAINGSIFSFGWYRAIPGLIKPGHIGIYHFDAANQYQTQIGTVLGVNYTSTPQESDDRKPWITLNAGIVMHMAADQQSEDEVRTTQT